MKRSASGTPIVISDAVGCAPDIAAGGRVGRTFRLGDAADCARALGELFDDPPTRDEIEAVSSQFSLESAATGVLNALGYAMNPVNGLKLHHHGHCSIVAPKKSVAAEAGQPGDGTI